MKIYVAGKMRGLPCYNFEEFFYWARVLRKEGHEIVNPAEVDCVKMLDGWQYSDDKYPEILFADLGFIKECDAVFMLDSWEQSMGARAEYAFAVALGKTVMLETERKEKV